MESFSKLVSEYSGFMSAVILTANYGDDMPFHGKVLLHKVEKHYKLGNIRSIAAYVAMFLAEYPREDVPARVVAACQAAKLQRKDNRVGYPHSDGTYHWFGDK